MAGAIVCAPPCHAQATTKDLLVIGRIVSLLENGPKGTVEIAIINSPTNTDAAAMTSLVGSGKAVGPITLTATPMAANQLANSTAKVVYIPQGLSREDMEMVFLVAQSRKLITISTSDACLAIRRCAIAISTVPAVDIRLSLAAAAATDVHFGSTFRMMIKEVD